jgi:hypothetical protein
MLAVSWNGRDVVRRSGAVPAILALSLLASPALAGEIEPRAYANAPVGINFLLAGYAYSDGDLSTEASSPLQDAQLRINTGILAYARSLDFWGNSGKVDVIIPYSELAGSALVGGMPRDRHVNGLNDPRFRVSVNFHGAPALSLQEFSSYQQDLVIGASVQVSAPLGQYDRDKLVNLGNNRWFVRPDIGMSKAWGPATLELSSGMFLFSDNEDYLSGKKQEREPIYTAQIHGTYNFGGGVWAALSGTFDYGGRTKVDGVPSNDLQNGWRVGATLALPVDRNNSIKLYASDGVSVNLGTNFTLFGIVWQYRWGQGL